MSKLGISSLFKSILLTAALAVSFTASAFTEGTDYMVLEKPIPNADKTLIKVFSYACPFCYKYDKAGNDSNLLIVFYVQIMPDDFVMQLHRF